MSQKTFVKSKTKVLSLLLGGLLAVAFTSSAYAFFYPSHPTNVEKSSPKAINSFFFPPANISSPLPVVSRSSASHNEMLDIAVIIDTGIYTYDGITAQSDVSMTDIEVEQVMNAADELFFARSGVHLNVQTIQRLPLSHLGTGELWDWTRREIEERINPPEAFVIFSVRSPSWMFGGFAQLSDVVSPASGYCNEFSLNQGILPVSRQTSLLQRNAAVAIVHWNHMYASCGYGSSYPGSARVSRSPVKGECRGNSMEKCVINNGVYYQCASSLGDLSAQPIQFRAMSVVHELMHTLDVNQYGHIGEESCNQVMRGDLRYQAMDFSYAERYASMCPRVFDEVRSRMRGCP